MSSEKTYWAYLVVTAQGRMRLLKGSPQPVGHNEFVYRIRVVVPASFWGTTVGTILLELPDRGGEPSFEVTEAE